MTRIVTTAGRLFQMIYVFTTKHGRIYPQWGRDALAFHELATLFYRNGYTFGGWIFSPTRRRVPPELLPVPLSLLAPADRIVLTTRPPTRDLVSNDRKRIHPSYTKLERIIFETVERYLAWCCRSRVSLAPIVAALLAEPWRDYGTVLFRQNGRIAASTQRHSHPGAPWVKLPRTHRKTHAFLLHLARLPRFDDLPELPCGLVVAFGMSGLETLIWNHRLATDFSWMLETGYRFAMVEMEATELPETPTTLAFADRWRIEVVLDVPLGPGGRIKRAPSPQPSGEVAGPPAPAPV